MAQANSEVLLDYPRRGRGRPKLVPDAAQAAAIREKAKSLFMDRGYGNTTTDDVAAECHISKQTLYRLFQSKPELFAAIVDEHRHSMLDLTSDYDHLPMQEALERIFRIEMDPADDHERLAIIRFVILEGGEYPELCEILQRRGGDTSRADLGLWLARQNELGRVRVDEPMLTAGILMDMIFGSTIARSRGRMSFPAETDRRSHLRRCIAIFLNGIQTR